MMRTVEEIQERIDSGTACVYTASELKEIVRRSGRPEVESVDVVTCATFGVMSGTMAILSVPVSPPGTFHKADSITFNGVPGTVGPCPNESLGLVDCIVFGTSRRDLSYGGGHLFKDLTSGKTVDVVAESDGRTYCRTMTLDDVPFARMVTTRSAFRNYSGYVNGSDDPFVTIFSASLPLEGGCRQASVSGCGEINPVQNDPDLRYLHQGSTVLLNGSPGIVLGTGTRSTGSKPNLSVSADMHGMDPSLMGGFRTSAGPECLVSVGTAIPILDDRSLDGLCVLDEDIPLDVADVRDRVAVCSDSYSSVWKGDHRVHADVSRCLGCAECAADMSCPLDVHPSRGLDTGSCMACGMCVTSCVSGVFSSDMGGISYLGREVPIAVRQSSRTRAEDVCSRIADMVRAGNWSLSSFRMRR